VSRKRGRSLGSHNKKTLAALAATAVADSAGVAPATAAAAAPVGAVAAATTAAAPIEAAAAIVAATAPVEAAVTIVATAVSAGAAPPGIAAAAAGGSASATADMACKPRCLPVRQRLSYTSEHGFTTFLAPLRAGYEVRLPLAFRFVDTLGGTH
jgi:hypothetical protein